MFNREERPQSVTVYCRRCRAEIRACIPGALVGCVACRLYTRATLFFCQLPEPEPRATVVVELWQPYGWRVTIRGAEIAAVVASLKSLIPAKQRTYHERNWLIAKRGDRGLNRFLDWAEGRAGVELIDRRMKGAA